MTLSNGDSLPAAIRFDGVEFIDIFETDYSATGEYAVMVTVSDPKSKVQNTDVIFSVIIKCSKSIDLVSGAIADFVYQIQLSSPFILNLPLPQY